MSGGISVGSWATIAATAVSAASTAYSMSKGTPDAPKAPTIQAPTLKQDAAAPDAGAIKKNAAAAYGGAGQESTLLTGLNGVAPGGLNLGKNTLLGM